MTRSKISLLFTMISAVLIIASCDTIEDTVADQAGNDFDESETIELDPVVLDQQGGGAIMPLGEIKDCGETSINAALAKAGVDMDKVDIDSVTLQFVELKYSNASWTPAEIETLACSVTFGGDASGTATISEVAVNGSGSDWENIDLDADAANVVNYYLNHRDATFSYCGLCSDEPETLHVEFSLNFGVQVKGEVQID